MPNRNRGVPCPIGLPRGAEALGTATTVMRRAALLPIRVRRRDRQDKLGREIIAHAVGEKLAADLTGFLVAAALVRWIWGT